MSNLFDSSDRRRAAKPKPKPVVVSAGDDLPTITIPPSSSKKRGKTTYSTKDLASLWIQAGGDPNLASTMAAIAKAESGGRVDALNDNAKTGDYSVGFWQINYFGGMRAGRTRLYGTPEQLRKDPLANAKAAVAIFNSQGLGAWSTYTSGAYEPFLTALTPEEKAAASAADTAARAANPDLAGAKVDQTVSDTIAKANDPAYLAALQKLAIAKVPGELAVDKAKLPSQIELEGLRAQARAVAHVSDPWVTVTRNRQGFVTAFGQSMGEKAPGNVLLIGGAPATQSQFDDAWRSNYQQTFEDFTGRKATPDEQADIVSEGISFYALKTRLSKSPLFKQSHAFREAAPGIRAYVVEKLGSAKGADDLVRRAIAEDWTADTLKARVEESPLYVKSPEYKAKDQAATGVYRGIYGEPDEGGKAWLKNAVKQGWTSENIAAALRDQPEYKHSLEAQANTLSLLDTLGMFVGARPIVETPPKEIPGTANTLAAFRDALKPHASPATPVEATLPTPTGQGAGLPLLSGQFTLPKKKVA